MSKLQFNGTIISIQPRIRLTRSFDESSHSYLGYAIEIAGLIDGDKKDFSIGIGNAREFPALALGNFQKLPPGVSPCAKIRAHCVVGGNPTE